jgi:SOS response regulatory protein OraA/RecX
MLSQRELSEDQLRARLVRRGHPDDEVDTAVARLRAEGAVNDTRAAEAIAHTETALRRRGRLRVKREIERAGIAPEIARQAVEAAFETLDDGALLEETLTRRLRGDRTIADERELARLFRYLVGQGFEPDQVLIALRKRKAG